MAQAMLNELQTVSVRSDGDQLVHERIRSTAFQFLQLEQQYRLHPQTIDQETTRLYEWMKEYTSTHERAETDSQNQPSEPTSSTSSAATAPIFFYLLHHHSLDLCTAFISSLYTDPNSDQDFYWLNDPSAFLIQLSEKLEGLKEENHQLIQEYARTKVINLKQLAHHVTFFSGVCEIIQTLITTRSRALTSQLSEVQALLDDVNRYRIAVQWQDWLAQDGSIMIALDSALASNDASSWHRSVAGRRAYRSSSHSRAFGTFLRNVESSDADLAALLVDEEYSEEKELFVDRLYSLVSNSYQYQHHLDAVENTSAEQSLSWTYPPPSIHSLLDIFFIPDTVSTDSTSPASPPYKLWLVYYLLFDFELRSKSPHQSKTSNEFAIQAGLDPRHRTLIEGMVHMDAAYEANDADQKYLNTLSPTRHTSFVHALGRFSADFDGLLNQSDFPMVSSILSSIMVLQQWAEGVTFLQNCLVANAAAASAVTAHALNQAQVNKYNSQRKPEHHMPPAPQSAFQPTDVFYSNLHYVFYIHILLQQDLSFDCIQFIRGLSYPTELPGTDIINRPLQVILFNYWNLSLLQQRKYQVLLKQVSLDAVEEQIILDYWKHQLRSLTTTTTSTFARSNSTNSTDSTTAMAPGLTPADLIILYHIEHHAIARGLRFYQQFQADQAKLAPTQRTQLKLPKEILTAYQQLVQVDLEQPEVEDGHELDLSFIQLRGLLSSLHRQQLKNAPTLTQILVHSSSHAMEMDATVDMLDVERPGFELNPFAPSNERARQEAAEAAVKAAATKVARARSSPAVSAASPSVGVITPSPPLAAAPSVEMKSPEKTPRVQKVSATLSAAKARRAALAKEQEELANEQLAEAAAGEEEEEEKEDAADSFPSFTSPPTSAPMAAAAPKRSLSTPVTTPIQPTRTASRAAALLSGSKPVAFSDMDSSSTATGASFLLPLADETTPAAVEAPSSKRKPGRKPKAAAISRTQSDTVTQAPTFTPLAPAALPDSSQFATSFLAPAVTATARLKSSRKRPLTQLPTHLPLASATATLPPALSSPAPALMAGSSADTATTTRSRRGTRSTRGAAAAEPDEDQVMNEEEPAVPVKSTRASKRTTIAHVDEDADVDMEEVASAHQPTRSTRRTAHVTAPSPSPPPPVHPNPFQRGRATRGGGSLFIDESVVLAAGSHAHVEEVPSPTEKKTRGRARAAASSKNEASPSISPSTSAAPSPARTTRGSRKTTAVPTSPAPTARTRTTRARKAKETEEEEEPAPVSTRATRSKAK